MDSIGTRNARRFLGNQKIHVAGTLMQDGLLGSVRLHKLRSGDSLWSELAGEFPAYGQLSGDTECEVLVLGAGVTGALIARHLAKVGVAVALVEEGRVGAGSTAASTGLLQYEIDTPLVELIGRIGEAAAVHAYRRGLTAIGEIDRLVNELNCDCGFALRHSLYFCSHPADKPLMEKEYECRRHFGFDVQWLDTGPLRDETSLRADAAIRSTGDAQIDPLKFTWALTRAAVGEGARVYDHTPILKVDESPVQVIAYAAQGRIRAKSIVYATGYHSAKYLGRQIGSLRSTYAVASQPAVEAPGWPKECLLWETARPYFYGRRNVDGRIVIGGEDTQYANDHDRETLMEQQIDRVVRKFRDHFPETLFVPEFAWAGTFGETEDGLAYIGQLPKRPNAYFAIGYGGNGITFSVIAAQLLSDLYRGRPNADASVFRFDR